MPATKRSKKPAAPKRKYVRKTRPDPVAEHEEAILQRLSNGETLIAICRTEGFPHEATVRQRALQDPDFHTKYSRAREIGYMRMADEVIEDAENTEGDWQVIRNDKGEVTGVKVDHDAVQRARLKIDTKKWLLSKALPKIYGDKVAVEHSGGVKVEQNATPADLSARLKEMGVDPAAIIQTAAATHAGSEKVQ